MKLTLLTCSVAIWLTSCASSDYVIYDPWAIRHLNIGEELSSSPASACRIQLVNVDVVNKAASFRVYDTTGSAEGYTEYTGRVLEGSRLQFSPCLRNIRHIALVEVDATGVQLGFLGRLSDCEDSMRSAKQQHEERLKVELGTLKARLDRLNGAFVEGGIDLAEFKEIKNLLIQQKAGLEQKLAALREAKQIGSNP